jgi:hypothetical protein
LDAICAGGEFVVGAGLVWASPGNSNIKGEKLGAAEMPAQPPPINGMTDASSNDFTTTPTFMAQTI